MAKTKEMTNMEIVDALKFADGSFKEKKLPVKMSYNIRRSVSNLKNAYNSYDETLNKLCEDYGCTVGNMTVIDPNEKDESVLAEQKEKQKQMTKEINDLLTTKTTVEIYPVPMDMVEECESENYDSLAYEDIDGLWWIIEEEKNEKGAE